MSVENLLWGNDISYYQDGARLKQLFSILWERVKIDCGEKSKDSRAPDDKRRTRRARTGFKFSFMRDSQSRDNAQPFLNSADLFSIVTSVEHMHDTSTNRWGHRRIELEASRVDPK